MPRKIIFILVLSILLSACAPALTSSPFTQHPGGAPVIGRGTPEGQGEGIPATTTPEVTATSAPSSTPEARTVELHPQTVGCLHPENIETWCAGLEPKDPH
jgi:hypothetical protein